MDVSVDILNRIRRITSRVGWTVTPQVLFTNDGAGILLKAGPAGSGNKREQFLIVAPTYAEGFRALAECLERICGRPDTATD